MFALLDKYFITFVLVGIGVFFVVMTYGANRRGRSGIPVVGGLFIAVGFLLSPCKWLAILGLVDYGPSYLIYLYVSEAFVKKRFHRLIRQNGYRESVRDDSLCMVVKVPEINEELVRPYITNEHLRYYVPKCFFAVCVDGSGKKILLIDKCRGDKVIDIIPFEGNSVVVTGMKHKLNDVTLKIEIRAQADMA